MLLLGAGAGAGGDGDGEGGGGGGGDGGAEDGEVDVVEDGAGFGLVGCSLPMGIGSYVETCLEADEDA